jgi:hypothetical protein
VDKLLGLVKDIIELMVNKKVTVKEELILSCVNGEMDGLSSLLDVPMQMDDSLLQQREKITNLFLAKNPKNIEISPFLQVQGSAVFEASEGILELEKYLKYDLHLIQHLFINFITNTE